MSGKRSAPFQIDQKTLEEKVIQNPSELTDNNGKDRKIPIQERKIFKIRVPGAQNEQKQNKINFKLQQSLEQKQKPSTQKVQASEPNTSHNIFANLAKTTFNGVGLFSNLPNTGFSNLFTSNQNTQNSSKLIANSNIFQNNKSQPTSQIINKKTQNTQKCEDNSSDQCQQDSSELIKQQQIDINQEKKVLKYEYKQTCPIFFSAKCSKFKKNNGDLISNVLVILQKDDHQPKTCYLSVKLNQTKTNIFTGIILSGKSTIKHINNKQENVEVLAITQQNSKLSKAILKLQFVQKEEGSKFYDQIAKLLKKSEDNQNAEKKQ